MSRYDNIYGITFAKEPVPPIAEISKRETDIYLIYNSADRLDMMSYRIYNDPQYWWLILVANGYQLEFDIEEGEILRFPYPLLEVLNEIKRNI